MEGSLGDLHTQQIFKSFVAFADVIEVVDVNDKSSISCAILCLFGVADHWSVKNQLTSAAHSTNSEVRTFYFVTKMVQWLRPIPQNTIFTVFKNSKPLYNDSQPTIDIIKNKHLTIRVKHIVVSIHYVNKQYVLLNINYVNMNNTIQKDGIRTKRSK